MNEVKLSNDLQQIELEIQHHKNIAGQSIWEIGKRLNHVKENDLTHGQFTKWLERVEIDHSTANRFMKVAEEIPYSAPVQNLGYSVLYLIATLPEEQKEYELEKAKQGDPSTRRELEEVKRKNREQEKTIEEQQKIINEQANKKPEIVEVEVPKEVVPHDYDGLKSDNQQLEFSNRRLRKQMQDIEKRNDFIEKQYNDLLEQRKEVDEKSKKYDELNQAIQEMQGKMTRGQKQIQAQKDVYDLVRKAKELLIEITPIPYVIDAEYVNENEYAKKALLNVSEQINKFLDNLNGVLDESKIIEGDFTNGE